MCTFTRSRFSVRREMHIIPCSFLQISWFTQIWFLWGCLWSFWRACETQQNPRLDYYYWDNVTLKLFFFFPSESFRTANLAANSAGNLKSSMLLGWLYIQQRLFARSHRGPPWHMIHWSRSGEMSMMVWEPVWSRASSPGSCKNNWDPVCGDR